MADACHVDIHLAAANVDDDNLESRMEFRPQICDQSAPSYLCDVWPLLRLVSSWWYHHIYDPPLSPIGSKYEVHFGILDRFDHSLFFQEMNCFQKNIQIKQISRFSKKLFITLYKITNKLETLAFSQ